MASSALHAMKRLEVVIEGEHVAFVEGLSKDAGMTATRSCATSPAWDITVPMPGG